MKKIAFATIISFFVLLSGWYFLHDSSLVAMYNERWNISLSKNMEIQYNLSSDHGITGDGDRYSVFKISDNDGFINSLQSDSEKEIQNEFIATINELKQSDNFQVDKNYYPSFSNYSCIKFEESNDKLLIIYSKDQNMIYILEELV